MSLTARGRGAEELTVAACDVVAAAGVTAAAVAVALTTNESKRKRSLKLRIRRVKRVVNKLLANI